MGFSPSPPKKFKLGNWLEYSLPTLRPCLLPVKNKILQMGGEADEFALVFFCDVGMGDSQGTPLDFNIFEVQYILLLAKDVVPFFIQLFGFSFCQH